MKYKCESCGRIEKSDNGPPKCMCGMPYYMELMKPITEEKEDLKEYLLED